MKTLLRIVLTTLCVAYLLPAPAQTPGDGSSSDFDFAIGVVECAYAGFADKTTGRESEYAALKTRLQSQIIAGRNQYDALAEYLGWFDDSHLGTQGVRTYRPKSIRRQRDDYRLRMACYQPQFTHCRVDASTYLIRFPSCDLDAAERSAVQAAVDAYLQSGCDNLIVDIRGNDGGNDAAYEPIFALLYDHEGRGDGVEYRASAQSIGYVREFAGNTARGQELIRQLEQAPVGAFVARGDKTYTIRRAAVSPLPRRAALIVDAQVASSGEQLVLDLRASSHRTTIYGRDNTMGCLDYSNCALSYFGQDSTRGMQVPVTRSFRIVEGRGIDADGIAPDVRIPLPLPATLTDNVDEWVLWVTEEMKKN